MYSTKEQRIKIIEELERKLGERVQVDLPFEVRPISASDPYAFQPIYHPKGGMHLVTMGLVKIKDRKSGKPNAGGDIDILNNNGPRVCPVKQDDVGKISALLSVDTGLVDGTGHDKEGYRPRDFEPPVVGIKLNKNGTFNRKFWAKLVTGKHRAEGHIQYYFSIPGTDEVWMWVAICVFDNDKVMEEYAAQENNRSQIKKYSSFEDVVHQLHKARTNGDCDTESVSGLTAYLKEYLLWTGPSPEGKTVKDVVEEVRNKLGKPIEKPLEVLGKNEKKIHIKDVFGHDINESKDPDKFMYTLRVDQTVTSTDRWKRLEDKVIGIWKTGYRKLTIYCGLSDAKSSNIVEKREMVESEFVTKLIAQSKMIVDLSNKKLLNTDSIEFIFDSATEEERKDGPFVHYDMEGNRKNV